jgi:hypothetical protein
MRALQCNCNVYFSSAHPDHLRDPHCHNCGAKVQLVEPEPDHDVMIDNWRYNDLMKEFRGE